MFQSLRATIVVFLVAVSIPSAHAENKEKARELYRSATHHYDFGEYQEALEAFKEAYQSYEDPAFLFNIAQCHRALGHKQEAITFYKSYLRNSSDAPNREEVQKTIAELQTAVDGEKLTARPTPVAPSAPPPPVAQATATTTPGPTPTTKSDNRTHRRTWVWGVVAATVGVVALGVGLGIGLSPGPSAPSANTSAGTFRF